MPFVRKLANKLISLQNEEIANFLDSIPEWSEWAEGSLKKSNEIESKALGNKKEEEEDNEKEEHNDDFFDMMFKLKAGGTKADKKEEEEEEDSDEED